MTLKSFTVAEAALELGLKKQQVLNRINRKVIRAVKKGCFYLIPPSAVAAEKERLAQSHKTKAK